MPTLFHLDSSPLEGSISRELTREFAKTWKSAHPDGVVIRRDLAVTPLRPIDGLWIGASFTPADARTAEQNTELALSDELISELETAGEYVFGVAMHNFSIPSTLKLWIDQIARAGRTFSYDSNGARGLLLGKKATVIVASGGVYEIGTPMAAFNHIDPYLKSFFGFLGVTDIKFVSAGGVSQLRTGAVDRATFLQPTLDLIRTAVV